MSNLLNRTTKLPVYKEATGIKYPFMEEYTKVLMNMFWKFDSVDLGEDVKHYQQAQIDEKTFIEQLMKLFTQNEVVVTSGYVKMANIFKPNEVVNWCLYAAGTEVTHEMAYSLFTETIGLPDTTYTDFLDVNVMSTKTTYLDKAKVRKFEEYKAMGLSDAEADRTYRRAVAAMLALYGGGAELVSLYAQFAMLMAFQLQGKYPGLCTIVEYSVRDEYTHGIGNCHLFRQYILENQDIWDDTLKFEIYEGMRELVAYEEALIDYLNPPHVDANDCKLYVRFRADQALKELGMKPNYHVESHNFDFMEALTGKVLTDFFSGKVTAYSRKMLGSRADLRAKLKAKL
jgi:ribonucleoside-diphosphate reductase beta chain